MVPWAGSGVSDGTKSRETRGSTYPDERYGNKWLVVPTVLTALYNQENKLCTENLTLNTHTHIAIIACSGVFTDSTAVIHF